VLLENYKVGDLVRYGLDYAALSAVNPALIYCSITGYGQFGPYAERPGYDPLMAAAAMMVHLMARASRRLGLTSIGIW